MLSVCQSACMPGSYLLFQSAQIQFRLNRPVYLDLIQFRCGSQGRNFGINVTSFISRKEYLLSVYYPRNYVLIGAPSTGWEHLPPKKAKMGKDSERGR